MVKGHKQRPRVGITANMIRMKMIGKVTGVGIGASTVRVGITVITKGRMNRITPTTPRGRSTPRASRSPPRYEPGRDDREWEDVADDPPAPRGHTTARTSRNTPRHQAPQARDDGRRYQLANAKAPSYQPLPKSITFNGSGNWRAFYRKFDAFAKQMSWGYPQRLNQLSWCLEGRAIDFFDLVLGREPRLNYVEVVERMGRRFDYQDPA